MNEAQIRERVRAAVGESTYPTDFSSRVSAHLKHSEKDPLRHGWALALVAAVLAIVIVVTLVFSAQALRQRSTVPGHFPPSAYTPASPLPPGSPPPGGSVPAQLVGNWTVPPETVQASL